MNGLTHLRRVARTAVATVLLLGAAGCSLFHDDDTADRPGVGNEVLADAAAYTVSINVTTDDGLKDAITSASRLIALEDSPPPTLAALKRRADDDADRFRKVMESRGYYDSDVTVAVNGEAAPYAVDVSIAPGERYTLAAFEIAYVGGIPDRPAAIPTSEDIRAGIGGPAVADDVVATESRLVRWLKDHGYPFATVVDRLVLANHPDRNLWVQVSVETGPLVSFGPLEISGLERSDRDLVERYVSWKQGDVYVQSQVDRLRNRLVDTGVFSSVIAAPAGDAAGGEGERPIDVTVTEGPPRSVSVGLGYATDLGPELRFGWEHRNLFGEAELLSLRTTVGIDRQRVDTLLRKPDFLRLNQNLVLSSNLINENLEAYDQTGVESSALIERPFGRHLTASAGVANDFFRITDTTGPTRSLLFGLPVALVYDRSDDLLNPTEGFRLRGNVTPWAGQADGAVQFLSTEVSGTAYVPFDSDRRIVGAVRGQIGTIWGTQLANIPANRRFYAGGGGSIRGYEFQRVGPIDRDNNPVGGESLLVVGTELRLMVTEEIGVVPFIEGGNVYPDTRPDFSEDLFWGTGIGVRYLTAVGPVRFDIAVPLDRRRGIDDAYQFYISLGQAF